MEAQDKTYSNTINKFSNKNQFTGYLKVKKEHTEFKVHSHTDQNSIVKSRIQHDTMFVWFSGFHLVNFLKFYKWIIL